MFSSALNVTNSVATDFILLQCIKLNFSPSESLCSLFYSGKMGFSSLFSNIFATICDILTHNASSWDTGLFYLFNKQNRSSSIIFYVADGLLYLFEMLFLTQSTSSNSKARFYSCSEFYERCCIMRQINIFKFKKELKKSWLRWMFTGTPC